MIEDICFNDRELDRLRQRAILNRNTEHAEMSLKNYVQEHEVARNGWLLNARFGTDIPRRFYAMDFMVRGYAVGLANPWPTLQVTTEQFLAARSSEECHGLVGDYQPAFDPVFEPTRLELLEQLYKLYPNVYAPLLKAA